jgi:hypothetical protein
MEHPHDETGPRRDSKADPLTRLAVIYFLRDIDRFLALSPEEIQVICREADVDEEGFKNVCRVLIGCAARRDRVN